MSNFKALVGSLGNVLHYLWVIKTHFLHSLPRPILNSFTPSSAIPLSPFIKKAASAEVFPVVYFSFEQPPNLLRLALFPRSIPRYHNFNPSVSVFFYFFQAKLGSGRPVSWTSLNGFSGRPILAAIYSSYKDFKSHYFKLRGSDLYPDLLFFPNGEPKFPFFWTKNPNRMLGVDFSKLTDLEQQDALLLQSYHPISCSLLIENEGDNDALRPYIEMSKKNESFVPQMDAKAMKAFSRTNKRKQGPQVHKRTHTEKESGSGSAPPTNTLENPQPSSDSRALILNPGPTKWWHWFQGFEGKPDTEVTSIFDRRHPAEQVIRTHFFKAEDCIRVQKVGMLNTAKMAQTFAVQNAFWDQEGEVARAREVTSELESLREKFQSVSLEKEKLQFAELRAEKEKADTLLTEKSESLKAAEEKLKIEEDNRKSEVTNLKAEISFQYEQGFEKVVGQLKFLYPDLNTEEVGAFKEIQDGKLVEILDED
ncbi:hypothetical protein SESBI_40171 [Sesbania bispinosa]|nr:hypothetical protein SESBI_40171 [Sesbania bispinosa]